MRALTAVVVFVLTLPAAAHAECAAEAERLADRYGVTARLPQAGAPAAPGGPPAAAEPPGLPPEALSQSGGVIAPPDTGRGRVIAPPATVDPGMPTAPSIRPEPAPGEIPARAAKAAQMESLIAAAQAAAERGDEAACARRLEEARTLGEAPG